MATETSPQTGVMMLVWFMIFAFVIGFGCIYYFESRDRAEETDSRMFRGDPQPPKAYVTEDGKPAVPPLEPNSR
jgi:hypothetical protein